MKHQQYLLLFLISGITLCTCIEPYQPKISEDYPDLLIIDGAIDASNKKAAVWLTHTMALDTDEEPEKETGAQVTLESQNSAPVTLQETTTGYYEAETLNIDYATQYRLTVTTKAGKSYQSVYVPVVQTPPIDSISWKPTDEGITIYANSHPSSGTTSTGYYKWSFTETWEYYARYYSSLVMEDGVVHERTQDENIYQCWKTVPSTQITVASSHNLSTDLIREFPVTSVPKASYQLSKTYSILVQQQSLTEEAYNYWLQLQKTTEAVGGLFDPLPSRVTGNFSCLTNPEETVIGFFSGSTVREQRIFIHIQDLPRSLQLIAPYPSCPIDSLPIERDGMVIPYNNLSIIDTYGVPIIEGYLSVPRACIDCREQGGVTTKPDFWE